KLTYLKGFSDAFRRESPEFDVSEAWLEKVSASGPLIFSVEDGSRSELRRLLRSEHLGSLLCAPVTAESSAEGAPRKLVAVLAAASPNPLAFTEADRRFLASVASLVQVHWQRLRL